MSLELPLEARLHYCHPSSSAQTEEGNRTHSTPLDASLEPFQGKSCTHLSCTEPSPVPLVKSKQRTRNSARVHSPSTRPFGVVEGRMIS